MWNFPFSCHIRLEQRYATKCDENLIKHFDLLSCFALVSFMSINIWCQYSIQMNAKFPISFKTLTLQAQWSKSVPLMEFNLMSYGSLYNYELFYFFIAFFVVSVSIVECVWYNVRWGLVGGMHLFSDLPLLHQCFVLFPQFFLEKAYQNILFSCS